ncbi:MAG: hypothetical protein HZA90_11230 [Verrucomicrobia bacterium]|nr:hypothetical protein [Verrucomicrobiota bacterium]
MILEEEVEKIRAVRQRISARCGHDVKRWLTHYQQVARELRASGQFRFVDTARNEPVLMLRETPPSEAP